MSTVEFCALTVRYGRAVAVAEFSFEVATGEWVGLIGPNGAGKSSLLRGAIGLVPAEGDVLVDGRSLTAMPRRQRSALVAYVPQIPTIPEDMTTHEYVLLGRTPYVSYFGSPTHADREIVLDVLDQLDLGAFTDRRLGEMSGGERQRVVIARALAQDTPVLVLDEPTSALDIGHQQQAMELVARLRAERRLTVIAAMHDLTLASVYSDRLALLHDGELVAEGAPAEVLDADTLAKYYGANVKVQIEADGTVVVIPRRGGDERPS
ncbi:MAG: ABC transporter ATP-binding protein [Actinomycetota bacterium]|nr:ABC transporter ATP-binding protein [Actinomycetota bacterium]